MKIRALVGMLLLGAAGVSVAAEPKGWYAFTATSTPQPGEIGLQSWLDKPAARMEKSAAGDNGRC